MRLLVHGLLGSGFVLVVACSGGNLNLPSTEDPVRLTAVSGGGQEARVGSQLPKPLVVLVTDEAHEPVTGVRLVFRFQEEMPDARITPATILTDSTGRASVQVRLGTAIGAHTIEASIVAAAPDARATFGVTALERRGGSPGGERDGDDGEDEEEDEDED